MKITLFFMILMSSVICSAGQTTTSPLDSVLINFEIEGEGVLKAKGSSPDYYIVEYKGKTAHELYTNVLSAVASIYKFPEKVLSKVEDVSITVSGTAIDVPVPKDESEINEVFPARNDYYGFDYTLNFLFKDGKIRINAPTFDSDHILWASPFDEGRYKLVAPVFPGRHFHDKNDKITIGFQKYINDLIVNIIKKSETINNW